VLGTGGNNGCSTNGRVGGGCVDVVLVVEVVVVEEVVVELEVVVVLLVVV